LRRQSDILSGAVGELVKVLTDHPRALVREYRLTKLFEALGSSAFIASYVIKNKTLDKLRPARATEKRLEKVRKPEVTNILCEQFDIFRKQHPDWKPNTPRRGAPLRCKMSLRSGQQPRHQTDSRKEEIAGAKTRYDCAISEGTMP
jgi:hypothetical protein